MNIKEVLLKGGAVLKNRYAKLFIDVSSKKIVKQIYVPGQDDYYKIVKENCERGYKQVIITSRMMTSVLKSYFYDMHFKISGIEFMVDDSELKVEIDNLLENIKQDRAYFGELLNKINFLSDESAIDIKNIKLKSRTSDNRALSIIIQVNGIYAISDNCFEEESPKLINIIERCIN